MDLKDIEKLMEAMKEKGMTKMVLKEKSGFEMELERGGEFEAASYPTAVMAPPAPRVEVQQRVALPEQAEAPKQVESQLGEALTSPMVGTYYASPSPDDDAFVKVGDKVEPDTVVCIIEAMKVMNEVKAGKSGVVKEIFVSNADPVEFGTKLLTIG